MCGIVGAWGKYDQNRMERALACLKHRGPDHTGRVEKDGVFLGHVRLSIIDPLPEAHQPFSIRDGKYTIIYNGELYNYRELIKEHHLECETSSDTEAVLQMYEKYGELCLKYFNGMFALAIWNRDDKTLFLARDRFGKKPLYYTYHQGTLYFASEIKALHEATGTIPPINEKGLHQYLAFLSSLAPQTIFEGIDKLPHAHYAVINQDGVVKPQPYFALEDCFREKSSDQDESTVLQEIETLLLRSVNYRLVADVEVGSFLSGGLDSSLISALYARESGRKIHTFSIGYDEFHEYDETAYAKIVADHISSEHHEIIVGAKDFDVVLDEVLWHLDEPINDPACIPTYWLSKSVHDAGIKAILSGEGSDEIFFGYDRLYQVLQEVDSAQPLWQQYRSFGYKFDDEQLHRLLRKNIQTSDFLKSYGQRMEKDHEPSSWISYVDLQVWLAESLMMKVDKMTMAHALEARAPYLDTDLVCYMMGIDPAMRVGRENKNLLKKIAGKYLPDEIIYRRKKGFSSPYLQWHYRLHGERILENWQWVNRETGWFDGDYLKFLYNEGKESRMRQHVWALVVLCRWFERVYLSSRSST